MSVEDFFEYVAYNRLEPFGDDREDMRAALMPWMLAGYFSKKHRKPKFHEFILSNMLDDKSKKPNQQQSTKQMERNLKTLFESTK